MAVDREQDAIPPHVRRFLLLNVASVPHLEAMLLMYEDPQRQWDIPQVAQRLYMNQDPAACVLADLQGSGIIAPAQSGDAPKYIYQPASDELRDTIRDVAHCYAKNLRLVTNLIHSRTATQAQQFADAFKLHKDS
mgnify:CR=1 FL=1